MITLTKETIELLGEFHYGNPTIIKELQQYGEFKYCYFNIIESDININQLLVDSISLKNKTVTFRKIKDIEYPNYEYTSQYYDKMEKKHSKFYDMPDIEIENKYILTKEGGHYSMEPVMYTIPFKSMKLGLSVQPNPYENKIMIEI